MDKGNFVGLLLLDLQPQQTGYYTSYMVTFRMGILWCETSRKRFMQNAVLTFLCKKAIRPWSMVSACQRILKLLMRQSFSIFSLNDLDLGRIRTKHNPNLPLCYSYISMKWGVCKSKHTKVIEWTRFFYLKPQWHWPLSDPHQTQFQPLSYITATILEVWCLCVKVFSSCFFLFLATLTVTLVKLS